MKKSQLCEKCVEKLREYKKKKKVKVKSKVKSSKGSVVGSATSAAGGRSGVENERAGQVVRAGDRVTSSGAIASEGWVW